MHGGDDLWEHGKAYWWEVGGSEGSEGASGVLGEEPTGDVGDEQIAIVLGDFFAAR